MNQITLKKRTTRRASTGGGRSQNCRPPLDASRGHTPTTGEIRRENCDPGSEGAEARPTKTLPLSPAVKNAQKNCKTAWAGAPVGIVQLRKTREQFLPALASPGCSRSPTNTANPPCHGHLDRSAALWLAPPGKVSECSPGMSSGGLFGVAGGDGTGDLENLGAMGPHAGRRGRDFDANRTTGSTDTSFEGRWGPGLAGRVPPVPPATEPRLKRR